MDVQPPTGFKAFGARKRELGFFWLPDDEFGVWRGFGRDFFPDISTADGRRVISFAFRF